MNFLKFASEQQDDYAHVSSHMLSMYWLYQEFLSDPGYISLCGPG